MGFSDVRERWIQPRAFRGFRSERRWKDQAWESGASQGSQDWGLGLPCLSGSLGMHVVTVPVGHDPPRDNFHQPRELMHGLLIAEIFTYPYFQFPLKWHTLEHCTLGDHNVISQIYLGPNWFLHQEKSRIGKLWCEFRIMEFPLKIHRGEWIAGGTTMERALKE